MNEFNGFDDLASDLDAVPVKDKAVKWPCPTCKGTGQYQGARVHQHKSHCFACKGRGHFLTSPEQRDKAKKKRQQKALAVAEAITRKAQEWRKDNAELHAYLTEVAGWNNFANSLLDSVSTWGGLTDGQFDAAVRMWDKHKEREADKIVRREKRAAEIAAKEPIDLGRIKGLFDKALASGLKRPVLRLGALSLKLAPKTGKNPGCVYVFDHDNYMGKVLPDGRFVDAADCLPNVEGDLMELASDPLKALTAYGKRTGQCSCCGRELTNPASVAAGIGPICAGKWGL